MRPKVILRLGMFFLIGAFSQSGLAGKVPSIVCQGNKTYRTEEIIRGLYPHPDMIAALQSNQTPREIESLAERLIQSGYREGGFPNVEVTCKTVEGGLSVRIAEGTRYKCDGIEIIRERSFADDALIRHLTSPQPQENTHLDFEFRGGERVTVYRDAQGDERDLREAVWVKDWPIDFNGSFDQPVIEAIAGLGFIDAKVATSLELDDHDETAELVIKVIEQGAPATIKQIKLGGRTTQAHEDLIQFTDLRLGQICSSELIHRTSETLWESGRFHSIRIFFKPKKCHLVMKLRN